MIGRRGSRGSEAGIRKRKPGIKSEEAEPCPCSSHRDSLFVIRYSSLSHAWPRRPLLCTLRLLTTLRAISACSNIFKTLSILLQDHDQNAQRGVIWAQAFWALKQAQTTLQKNLIPRHSWPIGPPLLRADNGHRPLITTATTVVLVHKR